MYKLGVIEKSILNSCVDDLVCKFCHCTGESRLMVTGQLSTMATFFCPQGGHCREVQLYLTGFETEDRHGVMQVFILENIGSLQN